MYTISLTIIIKMATSVTISAVYLQSMETYPTCLRQTGMSIGMILSNLLGICGPYIVYLVRKKFRCSAQWTIAIYRSVLGN